MLKLKLEEKSSFDWNQKVNEHQNTFAVDRGRPHQQDGEHSKDDIVGLTQTLYMKDPTEKQLSARTVQKNRETRFSVVFTKRRCQNSKSYENDTTPLGVAMSLDSNVIQECVLNASADESKKNLNGALARAVVRLDCRVKFHVTFMARSKTESWKISLIFEEYVEHENSLCPNALRCRFRRHLQARREGTHRSHRRLRTSSLRSSWMVLVHRQDVDCIHRHAQPVHVLPDQELPLCRL